MLPVDVQTVVDISWFLKLPKTKEETEKKARMKFLIYNIQNYGHENEVNLEGTTPELRTGKIAVNPRAKVKTINDDN
jgi:hypothetical protein